MTTGLIHHIQLYVSNLECFLTFWSWLLEALGYQIYQSWDQGKSWKSGDTYLVFVQADEAFKETPFHPRAVGLNHLAFHATSHQQVDDFTQSLRERGVRILYEPRHPFAGGPNHYAVFFEDSDRIKVDLLAPSGRETLKSGDLGDCRES